MNDNTPTFMEDAYSVDIKEDTPLDSVVFRYAMILSSLSLCVPLSISHMSHSPLVCFSFLFVFQAGHRTREPASSPASQAS